MENEIKLSELKAGIEDAVLGDLKISRAAWEQGHQGLDITIKLTDCSVSRHDERHYSVLVVWVYHSERRATVNVFLEDGLVYYAHFSGIKTKSTRAYFLVLKENKTKIVEE